MSLSYYILLPTIIYLRMYFETYKFKYLFLTALSTLLIIAIGSRGAIMCLGVYIIFYYLINMKRMTLQRLIFHIAALLIIFILFMFYKDILLYIFNVLEGYGIRSRSIILFLRDGIYLSGREEIYAIILEQIKCNPLYGIGIAGDRVYL
ncbi:MAG: O-Antigen ligase [Firmicutes bacterium ADurb.Bin419]|nr:MAG: O-Antigen ligase [Firmicutes bacterium ADurb.Bin419]